MRLFLEDSYSPDYHVAPYRRCVIGRGAQDEKNASIVTMLRHNVDDGRWTC
jgi:hypothetical protein